MTFAAKAAIYRAEYDVTQEADEPMVAPVLWDEAEDFDVVAPVRPTLTLVVNEFDREWGVARIQDDTGEEGEDG